MLGMQVDCAWCVASHDRQSPHFYALCDAPFQAPPFPGRGFFYVQDERYAAGAGMRRSGVRLIQLARQFWSTRYAAGAGMRRSGVRLIQLARQFWSTRYAAGAGMRRSGVRLIQLARQFWSTRLCSGQGETRNWSRGCPGV
jgi:hypothetical protein